MATAPALAGLALAGGMVLGGCDLAALGTGRTDCGELTAVECREALLLAAARLGPAPGAVVADLTCPPGSDTAVECPSTLDWTIVYPLPDGTGIALRIQGAEPNAPVAVSVVTEVPEHVAVRIAGTELLASPSLLPTPRP